MKSKRVCQGYDPVFQAQGPHSLHPAPSSTNNTNPASASSVNSQPRRFAPPPISPPVTSHNSSIISSSPRDHTEYPFPRPPEQLLPHLNQPYHMDNTSQTGIPPYPQSGRCEYSYICHCALCLIYPQYINGRRRSRFGKTQH